MGLVPEKRSFSRMKVIPHTAGTRVVNETPVQIDTLLPTDDGVECDFQRLSKAAKCVENA